MTIGLPILVLALFVFASAAFRPVLAPDETRYLTVAWEMLVRGDFVLPTVNFAPYHHKPPLLFWLIDIGWALFGVSRIPALVTVIAISASVMLLTRRLAREIFPDEARIARIACWLTLGNAVFAIYCGLILFDLLLTATVTAAMIALLIHLRAPARRWPLLAGLAIGLGVLAKGPVVLIFVLWPVATYPLWRAEHHVPSPRALWKATGIALLAALLPVAAWVVPVLVETHGEFARQLIWDQTAGRISGHLSNSHRRPVWFYLPLLLVFALPWLFSPYVWAPHRASLRRPVAAVREAWRQRPAIRFLLLWVLPVVLTFSLIAGKQPHYLVPLLPAVVILGAYLTRTLRLRLIALGATLTLGVLLAGQAATSSGILGSFDLAPLADDVARADGPVAFVGDYQGEFGFLARLARPIAVVDLDEAADWLAAHPEGMLVTNELDEEQSLPGHTILRAPFGIDHFKAASLGPDMP
ncbi:glycosyltransferase family 39 protein [Aurantimonas sp. VKM B-3413]|uniref:ArnT family glycosyltransferase n=1 Tax=Aurantimonas sp. VKM B-3413 TaxID=2779401 RepID=UPI001E5B6F6F|nr:glycosyltransferase family 39 protein [Aurantimonas sp. VKM B-3413]MCB8837701.1 glycosyltransferase family 39 protein [Aurantimonas sp. VKM B-3413]